MVPPSRLASRSKSQQGQSLVELAVTLPFLLLAALALLQFSLYVHAENVVTTACAEGTIVASAENGTLGEGVATARSLVGAGLGREVNDLAVQGASGGRTVALEARGTMPLLLLGPLVQLPLHARSVMIKES